MRTLTRAVLPALLAGCSVAMPATAHATTCVPTDPIAQCTPPPPPAARDLVQTEGCSYEEVKVNFAGYHVIAAEAIVPYATSVTIACNGVSDLGPFGATTTTAGQVGAVATIVVLPAPVQVGGGLGTLPICTHVSWTYSDGTGGATTVNC